MSFEHRFIIHLHDTDAAGILFFGHLFRHMQDAYESFMHAIGFPLDEWLRAGQTLLPLTHAEADYRRPLRHGDRVRAEVSVLEIRQRSFAIGYRFVSEEGEIMATARTVHVQVDAERVHGSPVDKPPAHPLPEPLVAAFTAYLAP